MTEAVTLTREEIYALVWSEPITALAKRFLMTEYQLRQLCIRWSVPLPRQFHWKKVRAGEWIEPPPLPLHHKGESTVTVNMVIASKPAALAKQSNSLPSYRILEDSLVSNVRQQLVHADKRWLNNGLIWTKGQHFRVGIAPGNIDRACRFLSAFLHAIRRRGYRLTVEQHQTLVHIGYQPLPILLRERTKRVIIPKRNTSFTTYHLVPSGDFYLHMTYRFKEREWRIGDGAIEEEVEAIVEKLRVASTMVDEYYRDLERGWARIAEQQRIERQKVERRAAELCEFKKLLQSATRWQQAQWIRNYICAKENKESFMVNLGSGRTDWYQWAQAKADWYDPLIEAQDEWLAHIDRNGLP